MARQPMVARFAALVRPKEDVCAAASVSPAAVDGASSPSSSLSVSIPTPPASSSLSLLSSLLSFISLPPPAGKLGHTCLFSSAVVVVAQIPVLPKDSIGFPIPIPKPPDMASTSPPLLLLLLLPPPPKKDGREAAPKPVLLVLNPLPLAAAAFANRLLSPPIPPKEDEPNLPSPPTEIAKLANPPLLQPLLLPLLFALGVVITCVFSSSDEEETEAGHALLPKGAGAGGGEASASSTTAVDNGLPKGGATVAAGGTGAAAGVNDTTFSSCKVGIALFVRGGC